MEEIANQLKQECLKDIEDWESEELEHDEGYGDHENVHDWNSEELGNEKSVGAENNDELESVETLNPRTRKWEISDLKLERPKHDFGYISLPNDFFTNL